MTLRRLTARSLGASVELTLDAPAREADEVERLLGPLLRHRPEPIEGDGEATRDPTMLRLRIERAPGCWVLVEEGIRHVHDTAELGATAALAAVNRFVIAVGQRELVLLHAGGVRIRGATVLLVAPSGSGKSTLTAGLVARGADYLGDEAVGLCPADLTVRGYPKPIALEPDALSVVGAASRLVDPTGSGARALTSAGRPDLVVLPTWVEGAPCETEQLDPAAGVMELARCTFGFAEHGERDVRALAGLARRAPVVALRYGSLAAAVEAVHGLARTRRSAPLTGDVPEVAQTSQEVRPDPPYARE